MAKRTKISTKIDEIEYTGGKDKYVSEDRNTHYTVGELNDSTNLSIYDNVVGLTKILDIEDQEEIPNYASTDDQLYTKTNQENLNFFFDVQIGENEDSGYTTEYDGFYILNNTALTDANLKIIANGENIDGGFIYMDSFFGYDTTTSQGYEFIEPESEAGKPVFFGNGQIEHIYCTDDKTEFSYTDSMVRLASEVAGWLNDYNQEYSTDYNSAFDVFKSNDATAIKGLTDIYASHVHTEQV